MQNIFFAKRAPSLRTALRAVVLAAIIPLAFQNTALAGQKVLLSYEATPSVGFHLPRLAHASYDDRVAFSAEVLKDIVPKIISANGIDPATLETEVTPGGYLLKTNASLQTEGELDDATADRLAGSLGYIFRQYSVLVSRLDDTTGKTGFAVVRFPKDTLSASVAQKFFEAADATKKGLGGGYTVFGDEQIFLNVTNSEGKPYSGLDDATFVDGLKQTAASFGAPAPEVSMSGKAVARFVGNDWEKAKVGEDYISLLGGPTSELVKKLESISGDYASLVAKVAESKGWDRDE
ncbi:hypothetical protein QA648_31175 (plasmid) [Rhizobium sp. CB3171]|uniref:hypothetical protein n=1 Tax=Rhizobium sp. CB3171 TaxID=3039157 RepID=UPI0024B0426C|nr:hypothetical protein [Rhizobium sp. CB3171]WFU05190.1 hypothetical protein QA648_31175 [Rhizobium sp. CB3171]